MLNFKIAKHDEAPFIGTSLSTTNGNILMHDESAILRTINAPFIFFVSVRREARKYLSSKTYS